MNIKFDTVIDTIMSLFNDVENAHITKRYVLRYSPRFIGPYPGIQKKRHERNFIRDLVNK